MEKALFGMKLLVYFIHISCWYLSLHIHIHFQIFTPQNGIVFGTFLQNACVAIKIERNEKIFFDTVKHFFSHSSISGMRYSVLRVVQMFTLLLFVNYRVTCWKNYNNCLENCHENCSKLSLWIKELSVHQLILCQIISFMLISSKRAENIYDNV